MLDGRLSPRSFLPVTLLAGFVVSALGPGVTASAVQAGIQDQVAPTAEAILARAREWAGAAALGRIRSLAIDATQGPRGQTMREFDVRLLMPDRFQTRQPGVLHAYEAGAFWMARRSGAVLDGPFALSVRENAERVTLIRFIRMAITFLGRLPEGYGVTVASVGAVDTGGLSGLGLRVSHEGRAAADLFVFDASDGRPLGYTSAVVSLAGGDARQEVARFGDYREVDGVRMPFHVESRYPEIVDWRISSITTNQLTREDFVQPGGDGW